MILTVLEARVPLDQAETLESGYRTLGAGERPPGLVRSQLIRSATDPLLWRVETLWASRTALEAMRGQGTPAGILLFRSVGAEPAVSIFDVAAAIE